MYYSEIKNLAEKMSVCDKDGRIFDNSAIVKKKFFEEIIAEADRLWNIRVLENDLIDCHSIDDIVLTIKKLINLHNADNNIIIEPERFVKIFPDKNSDVQIYDMLNQSISIKLDDKVVDQLASNECSLNCFFIGITSLALSFMTFQDDPAFSIVSEIKSTSYPSELLSDNSECFPVCLSANKAQSFISFISGIDNQSVSADNIKENFKYGKETRNALFYFSDQGHKTNEIIKSDFCLIIGINRAADGFVLDFSYASQLYSSKTIDCFIRLYENIFKCVTNDLNILIGSISLCGSDEKNLIINEFNSSYVESDSVQTFIDVFEECVRKYGDNTAVVYEGKTITYSELNKKANILANKLRDINVKTDDTVVLAADRSIEMIAAIYGIIKSGCAYVPVDPTYPEKRMQYIINDCSPKALVKFTSEEIKTESDCCVIELGGIDSWCGNPENPVHINGRNDLIYCIYTSGTTGEPKGVLIEHDGVVNLAHFIQNELYINSDDRVLLFANYVFDGSVWELLTAHMNGASLYVPSAETTQDIAEMEKYASENKITVAYFPPMYFEQGKLFPEKYVITAGSQTTLGVVNKAVSFSNYINSYGPTEATVCTTNWIVRKGTASDRISIGKPMRNKQVYILNGSNLCGIGVPGELCISGCGLARGYLNRKELTAEKFVKNPFGEGRMYRSGDLARWLPDGNIEYLGRVDEQVKIRGFRVELDEIDNCIRSHVSVKDCAVIARSDASGDKRLLGYYTSDTDIAPSDIIIFLKEKLPAYMIPSMLMQIDEIPLTRNGKVDKRALPEIEAVDSHSEYVAPDSDMERILCEAFSEILCVDRVGVNDSFFALGGHSLKAVKLVNLIEKLTGKRIAIKKVLDDFTPRKLASLLENTDENHNHLTKAAEKERYVMSSSQKRTFIVQSNDPDSTLYNLPIKITSDVLIDETSVRYALEKMTERHEILRTVFKVIDKEYCQIILDKMPIDLKIITAENASDDMIESEFVRPFDLENGPLFRCVVVKRPDCSSILLDFHHIICDGMSIITILKEFSSIYNGADLPEVRFQYKDYSEWVRNNDYTDQGEYWKSILGDDIPVLDMPIDYPRKQMRSFAGDLSEIPVGAALSEKIKSFADSNSLTEFMVFLAALMIIIGQYSRQDDILIGTPASGRTNRDTEDIIGMFVNTLVMRGKPETGKKVSDFLREIREICLNAYENQDYPFEKLVESLNISNDMSRNQLFDIMLVFQNNDDMQLSFDGKKAQISDVNKKASQFDIMFDISTSDKGYVINIEYCTDYYSSDSIGILADHYVELLKVMTESFDKKIGQLDMVTEAEKNKIMYVFNDTKAAYSDKTLVEIFYEQVNKYPDRTALMYSNESMSYAEFNVKTNSLANELRRSGIEPEDFVVVIADRSPEMIMGIYSIVKAGGAYVPVDPTYPEERISFIIDDCKPKAVLKFTTESVSIKAGTPVIDLHNSDVWNGDTRDLKPVNSPENAIYCIYTSGTTGKPKGVLNTHKGVANLINWMQEHYDLGADDVIMQKTTFVFDVSASEIFWWPVSGSALALLKKGAEKEPEVIAAEIERYKVTVIDFVPSMLSAFLSISENEIKRLSSLKYVFAAGEALNSEIVKKFNNAMRTNGFDCIIGNIYGPTEASVYSTYWDIGQDFDSETVLIGKPISNAKIYILNGNSLCGVGVPGELCIAGDGLARGYVNRTELTKEKFVNSPFSDEKIYRSGDLARWLPDGNIEYIGRIDDQVKIRGFRIELGEIESRIRECSGVNDCAVIVKADATGDKAIYAYYTSNSVLDALTIKNELREKLPSYMLPAYMMQIEYIPTTQNGKLNRRLLPDIKAKATSEYAAPKNETEKAICEMFSEILNTERVGIHDDFFELGGHSLRASMLINRIVSELNSRISINDIFKYSTPEQIALNLVSVNEDDEYSSIPEAIHKDYYPMSSVQKRVYLIHQMDPDSVTYNMPVNYIIKGNVDAAKLEAALNKVFDRHEILRTKFMLVDGEPVQKILDHIDLDFEYIDSDISDEELISGYMKPFDLNKPPLLRMCLVNKKVYNLLMIDMHHIVSDGMSLVTFLKELSAFYDGIELEPLKLQYKDYSEWSREKDITKQAGYWKSVFEDTVPVLDMITDFPRPQEQSFEGDEVVHILDGQLYAAMKEYAKQYGVTEFMLFLAVIMVTLGIYSRQEDIVIGSPINGRTHRDTESMLGMFVNTLALRGKPEKNKSFDVFLNEIREICFKAYDNQEYPFEELCEAVSVQRDMSRNPLFDVMVAFQNNESIDFSLGGNAAKDAGYEKKIAKFDLTFNISDNGNGYVVALEYCSAIYRNDTICRLIGHLENIIRTVILHPEIMIGNIEIATEAEKHLILNEFNATETDYPRDKTVVELFEEQVKKTPDKTALVFEDKKLTYAELNARANSLANELRKLGVQPDDFVAVIADRSLEMIAGIYGIIKAGGAYVPIDPTYPEDRIAFMLEDCAPKAAVVYTSENLNVPENIAVIDLSDNGIWNGNSENPEHVNTPNDLIYCIYTSGTTGKPKGVIIEHHGVTAMQDYLVKLYEVTENDNVLQFANYIFDASVWEMTLALYCGATLVLIPSEKINDMAAFEKYMRENNVTLTLLPPQYFRQTDIDTFRVMTTGGSASDSDVVKHVKENCRYINAYGPTENTVLATHWEYKHGTEVPANIPIGKPISNSRIYMLNGDVLCGIGIPGELCIAGEGLARGYLNRPELTAEKFVKNPFGEGRMYRSGDLARWLPDGNIEYLGRIDEQVKIRGFRIELGEIESRIREIEGIKDCAVIAKADASGDKAIYAYYTSNVGILAEEIRERLSESLPEYMIPAYMMQIEEIPVTRNGKLNRRALPDIELASSTEYVAPRNEIEERVCNAFAEILKVERVGVNDSFFALGGDSIKAIRIIAKLRTYGYSLSVKDIMNGKNSGYISSLIKEQLMAAERGQQDISGEIILSSLQVFMNGAIRSGSRFPYWSKVFDVTNYDNSQIHDAIEHIVIHHDMLRSVLHNDKLSVLPASDNMLEYYKEYDLTNSDEPIKVVNDLCSKMNDEENVDDISLFNASVFNIADKKNMILSLHKTIADRASLKIVEEDIYSVLDQLKAGRQAALPKKTSSYIDWCKKLKTSCSESTAEYWNGISDEICESNFCNMNNKQKLSVHIGNFNKSITCDLIEEADKRYNTGAEDIFVCAVAMAVMRWKRIDTVAMSLLSDHRVLDSWEDKDSSFERTIGSFADYYPVVVRRNDDLGQQLVSVKELIRSTPDYGLSYRYLCSGKIAVPDVSFSFADAVNAEDEKYLNGYENIYSNDGLSNIAFRIFNVEGSFGYCVLYNQNEFDKDDITDLCEKFNVALSDIIDYCTESDERNLTISDLDSDDINDESMESINDFLSSLF